MDRESQRLLIGFRSHAALSPATFEPRRLSTEFGTSTLSVLTVCTRVSAMGCRSGTASHSAQDWACLCGYPAGTGPTPGRAQCLLDGLLQVHISHREDRDPGTMSHELITHSLSTYYSVSDVG